MYLAFSSCRSSGLSPKAPPVLVRKALLDPISSVKLWRENSHHLSLNLCSTLLRSYASRKIVFGKFAESFTSLKINRVSLHPAGRCHPQPLRLSSEDLAEDHRLASYSRIRIVS